MGKNILFAVCLLMFGLMSCGKGEDNCNQVFFGGASIFNDEVAAVNEAAQKYADDPSTANCNDYRDKVELYLDRLKDFRDCVPTSQLNDFDRDIEGIEDQLDTISC